MIQRAVLKAQSWRIEWIFVSLLAFFGLIFIVIIPPFQAPDEWMHFYRAYAISELDLFSVTHAIPKSVNQLIQPVANLPNQPNEKIWFEDLLPAMRVSLAPEQTELINFSPAALYPPLVYASQATGALLARLLRLPPGWVLLLGRVANLLAFGLTGWLTLRIAPSQRWLFLALLLMPMQIFLAATFAPDVLTDGLALLLAALVLRMASSCVNKITWREMGWMGLVFGLVAASKAPYFLITLAYFIIPQEKFGNRKQYWSKTLVLFSLVLIVILVSQLPILLNQTAALRAGAADTPVKIKLQRMLQNPPGLARLLWVSQPPNVKVYYLTYIGVFGWLDTLLPKLVYLTYPLVLVFAMLERIPGLALNLFQRFVLLMISALVYVSVHILLYLSYTPVDAAWITGVQGRYFLPLGPLPYLAFNIGWLGDRLRILRPWAVTGYLLLALLVMTRTLLLRYYIF